MITNQLPTPQQRRFAVLIVPQSAMFSMVTQTLSATDTFVALRASGIPASAKMVSSFPIPERAAFGFVLEDESFDNVPEGLRYPEIAFQMEQVKVIPQQRKKPVCAPGIPHSIGTCECCLGADRSLWRIQVQGKYLLTCEPCFIDGKQEHTELV